HAVDFPMLIARRKLPRPAYHSLEGERIATRIDFDNETSGTATVLDIETEDRLGLLYAISRVFAELGLDISLAKISTEKGAAIDTFYVTEGFGQKILDPARQAQIADKLRQGISSL
ncbi:MAG TPA: [protein-PII] uridylyltransferase, partial [Verrucomicrobiae bacterium]|nr:[protein-PII] uridylyltransferase [Verrucomicrobiae bacterium]